MTPEVRTAKRAEMQRRWLAGEMPVAIAQAMRLSLTTVFCWRKELDLPSHPVGAPAGPEPGTEAKVTQLRELRASGLSVKQCAERLGISKNSAAGICHRHQIPSPPGPTPLERANAVLAARQAAKRAEMAPKPLVKHPTGPVKPVVRWTPAEELLPRAAIVPVWGCQFPSGTPGRLGFRFCGAVRLAGRPYCAGCCAVAYTRRAA